MGFLTSMVAKEYGRVLSGDYSGCKIGAKWLGEDLRIVKFGKDVVYKKDDIESYNVQDKTIGYVNVEVNFKDGCRSLIHFTIEGWNGFQKMVF